MSIQKYQALLKTVETGSITIAAQQLGYTQSAVSKMIQDLEQEWGIEVLKRSRKGVELTSEGLTIIPAVREIIADYDNLQYSLSALHGIRHGTLRLGCFSSVSASILPDILKSFNKAYPGIQVQLFHGEYGTISEWLRKGSIDCGFFGGYEALEFDSTPIFKDSLVAIVPPDHPLAHADKYPIQRIGEDNFINLKEEKDYDFNQFFDQHQLKPNVVYEVESDLVLLSMVEAGLGISLVYDMILQPSRFNVVRLPLDKTKERTVNISVRKGAKVSPIVQLFIENTLAYAKQNGMI